MHIIITGGAGFIGSACLVECLKRGWTVTVVDNFESTLYKKSRKLDNLKWAKTFGDFTLEEIDIRDVQAMKRVFDAQPVDVVLHLAAVAGVRPSIEHAPRYYDINVMGTSVLLDVATKADVKHIVLASSSSVYGGNTKVPFSETDPVNTPISPYAASKRALELMARTHQHLNRDLSILCLRFFTVYGPRQRPEMAIHKFMRLINAQSPIPMFGDGTTGRDYTYIDDIVAGVMACILHRPTSGFDVFNLGGDEVILLRELIETMSQVIGKNANINQLPMQPGDVLMTNADVTYARKQLAYAPQTSLKEGLEKMWAWYKHAARLNGFD